MTLKEKLKNQMNICGTHVTIGEPCVAEMMGYIGFDFLWIDLEHTYISLEQLYAQINCAKAAGTSAIVRVPQHDFTFTKKVLEMGVDGIIFPMIKNAKEAEEMIAYTLYPPYGNRGCGPKRAVRYGIDDELTYFKKDHLNICRFIQIEQKTTIDELEEIVKNPYIDGYILGMADLSGSINEVGDIFGENNMSLAKKAIEILKKNKKNIGISTTANDENTLRIYHDMGINMISSGADFNYIIKGAQHTLANAKKVQSAPLS